jgi:signal transduction histidine kinase
MNTNTPPVPANEMDRIITLSEFDLDYSDLKENFKDLTKLAAKVAGTEVSLINLIDTFTQWTVSNYGLELDQMPREDSVCQYTIVSEEYFEVGNLSEDERFKDKFYVKDDPKLRYYFGVPLQTSDGINIGALCVLDKLGKEISPEKVELLKIIAGEIVNRFNAMRVIKTLQSRIKEENDTRRKVAHDIRGPLGGIINLAQLIKEQGDNNKMDEVLEFIGLIQKSGSSLLELAEEILTTDRKHDSKTTKTDAAPGANELNLVLLKEKLQKLYTPQAINKKIQFTVETGSKNQQTPFIKNKLLQIAGNLISNAMKFTPHEGQVSVSLDLVMEKAQQHLKISVNDTGVGMSQQTVDEILNGAAVSTEGTGGEQGYGFGLSLVRHLVLNMGGRIDIASNPGAGTRFDVFIPITRI